VESAKLSARYPDPLHVSQSYTMTAGRPRLHSVTYSAVVRTASDRDAHRLTCTMRTCRLQEPQSLRNRARTRYIHFANTAVLPCRRFSCIRPGLVISLVSRLEPETGRLTSQPLPHVNTDLKSRWRHCAPITTRP